MRRDEMPMERGAAPERTAIGAFLRGLAERVELDPAFGEAVAALLLESGLLASTPAPRRAAKRVGASPAARAGGATPGEGVGATMPLPDPYLLLREEGVEGLRAGMEALDVGGLRRLIRLHRLDPARISARWTSRERLVELIATQVRSRADHGKAFARV